MAPDSLRQVDVRNPDTWNDVIAQVVSHLKAGGVVLHPTETLYGLGTLATPSGAATLRRIKGRSEGKPFLGLIADRTGAPAVVWNASAERIAESLWPGPLTLILRPSDAGAEELRASFGATAEQGVGLRDTPHPFLRALLPCLDAPLLSTSVNRAGSSPIRDAEELVRFAEEVGREHPLLFLDAGDSSASAPSTVIDCSIDPPVLVREGAITRDRVLTYLPELV